MFSKSVPLTHHLERERAAEPDGVDDLCLESAGRAPLYRRPQCSASPLAWRRVWGVGSGSYQVRLITCVFGDRFRLVALPTGLRQRGIFLYTFDREFLSAEGQNVRRPGILKRNTSAELGINQTVRQ